MAGRRPQPITQAANSAGASFDRPMPGGLMSSAVEPIPMQPQISTPMPPPMPQTQPQMQPQWQQMGGSPMSRPMPQQFGGFGGSQYQPFGGFRPPSFGGGFGGFGNPWGGGFGGGFGGGCGH